ncbi:hypothetical protein I4S89_003676, partial [Vibrio cholerae]|nr:hypothetical protein [Vibrio cholerae]
RCEEWSEISPSIITHAFPDDIRVKYIKANYDVAKHEIKIGGKIDLVIASYLLSEISDEDIPKVVENIKNNINKNATIVINDRNQSEVTQKIEKVYELLGCEYVSDNSRMHCDFSFDDKIVKSAQPKFSTSSIRYVGEL